MNSDTIYASSKAAEQQLALPEQDYDGVELCFLEEDDIQCGHIFFSESSRILKFFCTFCRITYDNIHLFCEHLTEHVNDDEVGLDAVDVRDIENGACTSKACREEQFGVVGEVIILDGNKEMPVEELDGRNQTETAIRQEMAQISYAANQLGDNDNCESEFVGYEEKEFSTKQDDTALDGSFTEFIMDRSHEQEKVNIKEDLTDFENLIQSTTIKEVPFKIKQPKFVQPVRVQHKEKKKRKVTTVKVIAVKNRIAELYAKIKSEEEKRSQANVKEHIEGNCSTTALDREDNNDGTHGGGQRFVYNSGEVIPQIIGETVITLLPRESDITISPSISPNNTGIVLKPRSLQRIGSEKDCVCPACGKKFRNAFSLTIHKRTHYLESNSQIKLAHKCCDCDELFNKISEMKDHLQKVHYPDGFICKICNKKLTSLTLLETHMRKVHLTRPFNCNICKKNFDNRENFEVHVNAHHVQTQNYRCHICGRKYPTEFMLNQHLRRHKEQIPQCCVVCGKMTLRITQHMKIHAPRPKRILSCKVCGKVFNFSSGLSTHFRVMHKFPRPPPKQKKESSTANITKRKRKPRARSNDETASTGTEEVTHKEEEAKRVIVELIQNATYTSFLPDNYSNNSTDITPPIAREETISAINSIVHNA